MHVTVFTANFMSPPTVGVAIWMLLVWPPETIIRNHGHALIDQVSISNSNRKSQVEV
jgi:hypothetical protein